MKWLEPHLESRSHIIFDWNGTLLNDIDLCVETINEVLDEHQKPLVTRESYRDAFRFPIIDYYKTLGFDFERQSFKEIADRFIRVYQERSLKCGLFEGTRELLQNLRQRGLGVHLLTAARHDHVHEQLAPHNISDLFDNICGISDHYGGGKKEIGVALLKKLACPPKEVLLIGDTYHDAEVAEVMGIDALIVADGHQPYEKLTKIHDLVLPSRF